VRFSRDGIMEQDNLASVFLAGILSWEISRGCDFCWSRRACLIPLIPGFQKVVILALFV
jgi:hypothetical protein